jgi:hypothetical protein
VALAELLPGAAARQRFRDETPGLPAALLTESMPRFPLDDRVGTAYVQLSGAYAATADQAEAAGWPVARYAMDHLADLVPTSGGSGSCIAAYCPGWATANPR